MQWLFFFLILWPCGTWNLSSWTRDRTCTLCVGRPSLGHWTTMEVSHFAFCFKNITLPQVESILQGTELRTRNTTVTRTRLCPFMSPGKKDEEGSRSKKLSEVGWEMGRRGFQQWLEFDSPGQHRGALQSRDSWVKMARPQGICHRHLLGLQRWPQLRATEDPEGAAVEGCGLPSSVPRNRELSGKENLNPAHCDPTP